MRGVILNFFEKHKRAEQAERVRKNNAGDEPQVRRLAGAMMDDGEINFEAGADNDEQKYQQPEQQQQRNFPEVEGWRHSATQTNRVWFIFKPWRMRCSRYACKIRPAGGSTEKTFGA